MSSNDAILSSKYYHVANGGFKCVCMADGTFRLELSNMGTRICMDIAIPINAIDGLIEQLQNLKQHAEDSYEYLGDEEWVVQSP